MTIRKKIAPYLENIAESGTACLVTMVQGNILLLGAAHWITATQTGLLAGTAAATAITLARTDNRLILAGVLGLATAIVDYFVHAGHEGGGGIAEAAITGIGAGVLSYIVGTVIVWVRRRLTG